jgi:UDP-N-acetylmuramoyl-L-alanyl-D-glutamate--2,6-diaminopimelate ligase
VTVGELTDAVGRSCPGLQPITSGDRGAEVSVTGVTHDSRVVAPGSVFVALRGFSVDGATFAREAVSAGAAAVVSDRPPPAEDLGVPWVTVSEARPALAQMAAELHGHPSRELSVVGITGTNGKTTTSYLLHSMFEAAGVRAGLMGTVSYLVAGRVVEATRTTPEAPEVQGLLREMVVAGCGACVMEVSSHALSLHRVDGTRFSAGVFTNLTRDHLDFHESMEVYFAAKRRLFEMLPRNAPALINVDDPRGAELVAAAGRPVTYSVNGPADVMAGQQAASLDGLDFELRTPEGVVPVHSRLVGRSNVSNILAAAGTAAALGLPLDAIARGVDQLPGVPGRFQVVSDSGDDITAIVDYAHTDDSLRNLLETARQLAPARLITVFGCGGDRDRSKRPLMGMVAARLSDVVVITSDNPRAEDPVRIIDEVARGAEAEARQASVDVLVVPDRHEAISRAVQQAAAGDVVLIAGKGHEKHQEIEGRRLSFDDAVAAREALGARRLRRVE